MAADKPEKTPIAFPCHFAIKVIGRATQDFEHTVLHIIHKHFPNFSNGNYTKKLSRDANFLALTITVHTDSKQQLDAAYHEINDCKDVVMAL